MTASRRGGRGPTTRRSPCTGGRELRARVSAAEYADATAAAAEAGLSLAGWTRQVVLAALAASVAPLKKQRTP